MSGRERIITTERREWEGWNAWNQAVSQYRKLFWQYGLDLTSVQPSVTRLMKDEYNSIRLQSSRRHVVVQARRRSVSQMVQRDMPDRDAQTDQLDDVRLRLIPWSDTTAQPSPLVSYINRFLSVISDSISYFTWGYRRTFWQPKTLVKFGQNDWVSVDALVAFP